VTDGDLPFLDTIRRWPDADAPRLTYADWLEENGDPLGEFIRVQCELAKLVHQFQENVSRIKMPQRITWGATLIGPQELRAAESRLLSATHEETCQRCKGNGEIDFGPPTIYGICPLCKGEKIVHQSNAVRWAGKLGGREAVLLNERGDGPWHIGYRIDRRQGSEEELARASFVRGFLDTISLSTLALMGQRCEACEEERRHARRYAREGNDVAAVNRLIGTAMCDRCHGSGYVGGLRDELARKPELAGLTRVELSDKRPVSGERKKSYARWVKRQEGHAEQTWDLPPELFDLLPTGEGSECVSIRDGGESWPSNFSVRDYSTSSAAQDALARAVCEWVMNREAVTV
jgi:uncharacterized protein (TIGR02996 family)